MKRLKQFLAQLFFINIIISPAKTYPINAINPELTGGYFEGDMILNDKQLQAVKAFNEATTQRRTRNALLNANSRWPKNIVNYVISTEFSAKEVDVIRQAMLHISSQTCIRFQQVFLSSSFLKPHFVLIRKSKAGCSASVGYNPRGKQYLNLLPMSSNSVGCVTLGIVVHELLHTLGMYHQQSSNDRDLYVRVRYDNIQSGQAYNFQKLPFGVSSSYGVGYDYASIMHYGIYAFSRNGRATIEPLGHFSGNIGQRVGLSQKDILKLRRMYNCPEYG